MTNDCGGNSVRYLIWDFDGTLARREGGWSQALEAVWAARPRNGREGRKAGVPGRGIGAAEFRGYLQKGFPWQSPEVVREAGVSADVWWAELEPVFCRAFCGAGRVDEAEGALLAAEVRRVYVGPEQWRLMPGAKEALAVLSAAGWRHVMLSNHVPELPEIARALGLDGFFEAVFCSAATGVEKPNAKAFEMVLAALPAGCECWMIGDSLRCDVEGAEAVGLPAVLVHGADGKARRCCASLGEVVEKLGGEFKIQNSKL